jgi:choline dehydrogenase-like flavoprotein
MAYPERLYRRLHPPADGRSAPQPADGRSGRSPSDAESSLASRLWYAARVRPARRAARSARRSSRTSADQPLFSLYFRSEQVPNPSSRVRLGADRDRFGLPRPALDWRVTEQDVDSVATWLDLLDKSLDGQGVGRVVRPEDGWSANIHGGPHQLGTTRMSSRPQDGVVDADCRVHSVANLYVTGGSVFTTGGHANPTITIMALSIRLADHLRANLHHS